MDKKARGFRETHPRGGETVIHASVNDPVCIKIKEYARSHNINLQTIIAMCFYRFVETEPWFKCEELSDEDLDRLVLSTMTREEKVKYLRSSNQ